MLSEVLGAVNKGGKMTLTSFSVHGITSKEWQDFHPFCFAVGEPQRNSDLDYSRKGCSSWHRDCKHWGDYLQMTCSLMNLVFCSSDHPNYMQCYVLGKHIKPTQILHVTSTINKRTGLTCKSFCVLQAFFIYVMKQMSGCTVPDSTVTLLYSICFSLGETPEWNNNRRKMFSEQTAAAFVIMKTKSTILSGSYVRNCCPTKQEKVLLKICQHEERYNLWHCRRLKFLCWLSFTNDCDASLWWISNYCGSLRLSLRPLFLSDHCPSNCPSARVELRHLCCSVIFRLVHGHAPKLSKTSGWLLKSKRFN